ncbi:MAG TPA: DUF5984 family protein [Dictyobacter sp.]|jgi:hypothetical protein|nr:DUF5984 family protein [Dictyobacter sp.]
MFFHFQLNPIAEIKPWGKKDEPVLHWFGLSDGQYWIQIGETELFRYSNMFLEAYYPQSSVAVCTLQSYVDYYVVRLWEDILAIMPTILDPLPTSLVQRVEPIDKWLQWCEKVRNWLDDPQELCSEETLDTRLDIYNKALLWWENRQLYTGPINFEPGIFFWSDGQFVHCVWDSRDSKSKDKFLIWASVYGTEVVPMTTFIEAVTSFNGRFISAMAERVDTALVDWSRPEIQLDLGQLADEHLQRSEHFAKCIAEIPVRAKSATEWESILEAISVIENDPDFLAIS